MYFKELEIVGFKSFPQKTKLKFEPGVTTVVGPNGCGKSNIADAIRWVLGEQSARCLRGSAMEDVIFNGTASIEPINMAEVSLTLSNETRTLPIDYDEVTITRRLFRSGESEYILNKTPVRLKDITHILMGTGMGTSSYFVIEQGKIDLILSSKPEERRDIFEEAAGITRYKAKKKEALKKLEHTENNLVRIGDIINEVKRQIASIERHAKKAERYKKDFDEMKELDLKLARHEFIDIENALGKNKAALDDLLLKEKALKLELDADTDAINKCRESLDRILSELTDMQAKFSESTVFVDKAKHKIELNKERMKDLANFKARSEEELGRLKEKIEIEEREVSLIKERFESAAKTKGDKEKLLSEKEKSIQELLREIEAHEKNAKSAKDKTIDLLAFQTKTKNELIKLGADLANRKARLLRLEGEKRNVEDEEKKSTVLLEEKTKEVDFCEENARKAKHLLSVLTERLSSCESALEGMRPRISESAKALNSVESKEEFLKESAEKFEGATKGVKAAMEKAGTGDLRGITGLVAGNIEPKEGYELKVESDAHFIVHNGRILGGFVKNEAKIEEFKNEKAGLREKVALLNAEYDKEIKSIEGLKREIAAAEDELKKSELALLNAVSKKESAETDSRKVKDELSIVGLEQAEVGELINEISLKGGELNAQLNEKENEYGKLQELISFSQGEAERKKEERVNLTFGLSDIKSEFSFLKEREEETAKSLNKEAMLLGELRAQCEGKARDARESEEKINFLQAETKDLTQEIEIKEKEESGFKEALGGISEKRHLLSQELHDKEVLVRGKEAALENMRNQIRNLEIKQREGEFASVNISDRIRQAYKLDINTVQAGISEGVNWEDVRNQVEILRIKLERLGTVNLVAIEEHKELEERNSFLTGQQDDLLRAKESLGEAIRRINATTKKLFIETFQRVQVEFQNYFKLLFGGGHAELLILDESDILESGIEIVVRPPGKKLQNLLLLSGGEKALIAIALLFAIFKVKPSPFCILDEVDAPLDESNITRFTRILKEFLKTSQFIVITHNKRTMEMANILYGITMQEKGVSRVVSVKFSGDEAEAPDEKEKVLV